jgi:hypothetical protein
MHILLDPDQRHPQQLRRIYLKAFREATELYIASAYLTAWEKSQSLSKRCRQLVFIVGTDFGLSRKAALRNVLSWIPTHGTCQFLAAPRIALGGFHPKVIVWRSRTGKHYALLGSSNLSKAGFGTNYEANAFSVVSPSQFKAIVKWLEPLIAECVPVTEDWIENHYREASLRSGGRAAATSAAVSVKLVLPDGPSYTRAVKRRRNKQATFGQIGDSIAANARLCASGKMNNREFWDRFWELWSAHPSRFQGSGLQYTGKTAKWRQATRALVAILDAANAGTSTSALDGVVSREIDRLAELRNPARGAWLSETLCHYFPHLYPIKNAPVSKWLKANKWRGRRGSSEGQRYIELARQPRYAVGTGPAGAKTLAELDSAIWLWVSNRDL